jgi:hypothetical protein
VRHGSKPKQRQAEVTSVLRASDASHVFGQCFAIADLFISSTRSGLSTRFCILTQRAFEKGIPEVARV